MSKTDRLIQELSIQKALFFGSIGLIFGVVAWVVANYTTYPWWFVLIAFLVVLCAMLFGYAKHKRMYQLLEELENV